MRFSIIIPARVITPALKNTLERLKEIEYQDFETIVVLDFEDHLDVEKYLNVKFIVSGINSPGTKRNLGIKESTGDFIAFLDDDAYPDSKWLLNASRIFIENPNYIGICGPSITPFESDFLQQVSGAVFESFLTSGPTNFRHTISKERFVDDYPSVNLIVRKFCLEEIGGFNENFWPGEDTKLCRDLVLKFKQKIFYSPELVVHHFRRNVYHPHLIQVSRYAFHRGLFTKLFPENSFRLTYFIPTFFVLNLVLTGIYFVNSSNYLLFSLVLSYLYIVLLTLEGFKTFKKYESIGFVVLTVLGIFLSNIIYGIYFVIGIFSKPKLVLRELDLANGRYLKG
jgi:glycosyltransferase involved in cell wall biosynthesis